jgi:WXG100 family type VII secretion target
VCRWRVAINGRIFVDLSKVALGEDEFQQILHALRSRLDRLDAELRASLGEWSGEAQAAYRVAHAQWQAAADDMAGRLAWLRSVLGTAHQNYHNARATNLGMWHGRR